MTAEIVTAGGYNKRPDLYGSYSTPTEGQARRQRSEPAARLQRRGFM